MENFSLNAPTANHKPEATTEDYTSKYFDFRTASNSDSGEYTVLGTAVYYKIYSDTSIIQSHNDSISSINKESDGSTAAKRLIESYKYVQLGTSIGSKMPLLSGSSSQNVFIRLMNYQTDPTLSARVEIDGVVQSWKPLRFDNKNTFDFGRNDSVKYTDWEKNASPKINDEDVYASSIPTSGEWYVNAYAISVGRDSSYTYYYSPVAWLGTVKISSETEDN